ncbi:hypothetical protein BsWGS_14947 [Bradybaena similaris]
MFHVGGHKGVNTRGRSSALSRHYPHFLSHVDWKAPLRCGILFCTISCILFVLGIVLTWLGVHNVIGESVPITGPILLSVGGLMLILAVRQFYMARVRKKAHDKALQTTGVAAIATIAEQDEEHEEAASHILKSGVAVSGEASVTTDDKCEKEPFITGGYYDSNTLHSTCGDTAGSGDYVWPPVAIQHPYYSMAMMVYKDPTLFCSPYLSAAGSVPGVSPGLAFGTNTHTSEFVKGDDTPSSGDCLPLLSPSSSQEQQRDSAVLHASSFGVQNTTLSSFNSDFGSHMECSKIFPADYLTQYQRGSGGINNSTNSGINNLPKPTAFTMLRTLELQETI